MEHVYDPKQIENIRGWLRSGSINIFGRPFAGKDTQGSILAELFDGSLLGGGEILRNSEIPPHVRQAQRQGLLIPSDDYVQIVLPYLSQPAFAGKPLILSSVGRWHGEEESVIAATEAAGHPMKAVFYLDIPEEEVYDRWRKTREPRSAGDRGDRPDDIMEALTLRLQEFRNKTLPVTEHYETAALLIRIDATRPAPEITARILQALAERARAEAAEA